MAHPTWPAPDSRSRKSSRLLVPTSSTPSASMPSLSSLSVFPTPPFNSFFTVIWMASRSWPARKFRASKHRFDGTANPRSNQSGNDRRTGRKRNSLSRKCPQSQRHLFCARPRPNVALTPVALRRLSTPVIAFASCDFPGYNRLALVLRSHLRLLLGVLLALVGFWVSSCAVALGPGSSIENQEIRVQFLPGSDPRIRVDSDYQLRNTGNQPLASLELRLPGRRSFHLARAQASWDGLALAEQSSPVIPRNTLLALPGQWNVSERHTLHLSAEFQTPAPGETGLSFTSDAFFLPSEGWAPELLPAQGLFANGGVPPKQWRLEVRVPDGFLVRSSGRARKTSR